LATRACPRTIRASRCSSMRSSKPTAAACFAMSAPGSLSHRPELDACLQFLSAGDTLVVWRLDRLGRGLKHPDRSDREPARPRDRLPLTDRADRHHHLCRTVAVPHLRRSGGIRKGDHQGAAPAPAWPPPAPGADSQAGRAWSPARSSPPPRRCERRSTPWPRSQLRSGSAARRSIATWRSTPSPTAAPPSRRPPRRFQ
jgi:Resolvase, N terminal domain